MPRRYFTDAYTTAHRADHPSSQRVINKRTLSAALLSLVLVSCREDDGVNQLSEAPTATEKDPVILAEPHPGTFALRARVRYADVEALAADQLPQSYPVNGSKQACKRIIGIKVCGTANWDLEITRPGKPQVRGESDVIYIRAPLAFSGTLGVEGRVAEALGLRSLDVSGEASTNIALSLQLADNWCPAIQLDVSYEWLKKPTLVYQGALDFSLESIVNDALDKQLATLETRLNESIDCSRFQQQLAGYWRSYSFALELPSNFSELDAQPLHLNIAPAGFAFSGIHTEDEALGVSFALSASTVLEPEAQPETALPLPPLRRVSFEDSKTNFNLILRADYSQLEQVIQARLLDKAFTTDSAAGTVSVTVTSFELSGNSQDVTVALGFTAQIPGRRNPLDGLVYLQARPEIDPENETLSLKNIRMSRILDSTLWNLLSRVFEGQIMAALSQNSELALGPQLRKLEQMLTQQLQDPTRTAGVEVTASNLSISVMEIVAESGALAARAQVATELDINIPLEVIQKPLAR